MKKLLVLGLLILGISALSYAQKPVIKFNKYVHDFGQIKEELGKVSYVFEFTNTGNADLILNNVQASCGCTTPDWKQPPIAPGKKGVITVTYTTTGRPGPFNKTITVTSNAEKVETLTIKGDVLVAEPK